MKVQCFECLRMITVNKDGRLRWHYDHPLTRWLLPAEREDRCAGSGWQTDAKNAPQLEHPEATGCEPGGVVPHG